MYKRSNDKETWIVALNNTTETANLEIPKEVIGDNKKLRGVLGGDLVREGKDGIYRVVLEREVAEIYIADEDKGFNTPYLIASILIYVLFLGFLFMAWRKGRQGRKGRKAERKRSKTKNTRIGEVANLVFFVIALYNQSY